MPPQGPLHSNNLMTAEKDVQRAPRATTNASRLVEICRCAVLRHGGDAATADSLAASAVYAESNGKPNQGITTYLTTLTRSATGASRGGPGLDHTTDSSHFRRGWRRRRFTHCVRPCGRPTGRCRQKLWRSSIQPEERLLLRRTRLLRRANGIARLDCGCHGQFVGTDVGRGLGERSLGNESHGLRSAGSGKVAACNRSGIQPNRAHECPRIRAIGEIDTAGMGSGS